MKLLIITTIGFYIAQENNQKTAQESIANDKKIKIIHSVPPIFFFAWNNSIEVMCKMFMFNMSVMWHMLWMMSMSNMFNNSLKTMMWISCIVNNSFCTIWFNQWIRTFYMICMPCFPCFFIITGMCIFDRISIFIIDWCLWNNIIFFIISNVVSLNPENYQKCFYREMCCLWV